MTAKRLALLTAVAAAAAVSFAQAGQPTELAGYRMVVPFGTNRAFGIATTGTVFAGSKSYGALSVGFEYGPATGFAYDNGAALGGAHGALLASLKWQRLEGYAGIEGYALFEQGKPGLTGSLGLTAGVRLYTAPAAQPSATVYVWR